MRMAMIKTPVRPRYLPLTLLLSLTLGLALLGSNCSSPLTQVQATDSGQQAPSLLDYPCAGHCLDQCMAHLHNVQPRSHSPEQARQVCAEPCKWMHWYWADLDVSQCPDGDWESRWEGKEPHPCSKWQGYVNAIHLVVRCGDHQLSCADNGAPMCLTPKQCEERSKQRGLEGPSKKKGRR